MKISCSDLFVLMLTVLFIGLKLTGYIDWNWFWVISPLWISVCILAIVITITAIGEQARDW